MQRVRVREFAQGVESQVDGLQFVGDGSGESGEVHVGGAAQGRSGCVGDLTGEALDVVDSTLHWSTAG